MDALTQLLESYLSTKANPMTDALAQSGISAVGGGLVRAARQSPGDIDARRAMSYAAFLSGMTLANAGLGLVHGMASAVGGEFDIPHGVVCANLMGPAMKLTLAALRERAADGDLTAAGAVGKFARAGSLLAGADDPGRDRDRHAELLVETVYAWTDLFGTPRLGTYGVTEEDLGRLASASENKNNPATVGREGIEAILRERL
jgi:alcohol dehydrogenase